MRIKNYNELNSLELDTLREVGSIGTGNAATALSALIGEEVRIELPEVRIMEYNEAIEWIGGPEEITAGVLVKMSGQIDGIMLSVQQLEFVNLILNSMLGKTVEDYMGLHEMECSALIEVGNIMISTFINALSGLADIKIDLTVPAFTVDMQGADGGLRRSVGLHHDHRRRLCPRREGGSLPVAALPGHPLFEYAAEKAGCQQWRLN